MLQKEGKKTVNNQRKPSVACQSWLNTSAQLPLRENLKLAKPLRVTMKNRCCLCLGIFYSPPKNVSLGTPSHLGRGYRTGSAPACPGWFIWKRSCGRPGWLWCFAYAPQVGMQLCLPAGDGQVSRQRLCPTVFTYRSIVTDVGWGLSQR